MVIYRLFEEPFFPNPEEADPDGLLAVGGDLSPERLLNAYTNGIFPWYAPDSPILWWSTDPRMALLPDHLHVSRSLKRVLNSGKFTFTLDRAFPQVVGFCADCPRPGQEGTWIVDEMAQAYQGLHELGYAHSVEAWLDGRLVGGLYGVSLGRVFFGESMFHLEPDASKAAFVTLVHQLKKWEFSLIDCQQATDHLRRFGAREMPRFRFMQRLKEALVYPSRLGLWSFGDG